MRRNQAIWTDLLDAARLHYNSLVPGFLDKAVTYCTLGLVPPADWLDSIRLWQEGPCLRWPLYEGFVASEIREDPATLFLYRRPRPMDNILHFVTAMEQKGRIELRFRICVLLRIDKTDPRLAGVSTPKGPLAKCWPAGPWVWLAQFADSVPNARRADLVPASFNDAFAIFGGLCNLVSPCGYRFHATNRRGVAGGGRRVREATRGQRIAWRVNRERCRRVYQSAGHTDAAFEGPRHVRGHVKYQWKRDAGFPHWKAPASLRGRQHLAIRLGVGYVYCPPHIQNASPLIELPDWILEACTDPDVIEFERGGSTNT